MTVISCSCDVFVRPGQHGFSWPTRLLAHTKPQNPDPISKFHDDMDTFVRSLKLFLHVDYFWDRGNRNRRNHPNANTILYYEYSTLNHCCITVL